MSIQRPRILSCPCFIWIDWAAIHANSRVIHINLFLKRRIIQKITYIRVVISPWLNDGEDGWWFCRVGCIVCPLVLCGDCFRVAFFPKCAFFCVRCKFRFEYDAASSNPTVFHILFCCRIVFFYVLHWGSSLPISLSFLSISKCRNK